VWQTHKRCSRRSEGEVQRRLYNKEHSSIVEREYLKK